MNYWTFFERKVCLTNQDHEWQKAVWEFERVGLTGVHRFQALEDIGPHQSFSKSARQILIEFHESESQTLLHLEDDVVFKDLGHLLQAERELPSDWDILYLGANLLLWGNGPQPERISEHLFRVRAAWTTHAIAYSRKVIPFILENQPGFSEQMLDNWLSEQLPNLNAYIVAPMVAYQRPRHSSIWIKSEIDDYTPIFEASEERLR